MNNVRVASFCQWSLAFTAVLLLVSPSSAQSNSVAKSSIDLPLCVVELIDDVDVAARQAGVLKELPLKQGQYVLAEENVGRVDDLMAQRGLEQASARLKLAEAKAGNDKVIRYYFEIEKYYRQKHTTEVALGRNATRVNLEEYAHENAKARNQKEQAQHAQMEAELEIKVESANVNNAKDLVERHKIFSPIEGHVFKIYKQAGSWVNAGDPVFRIIRMNKLQVKGYVSSKEYDRHEVFGQDVSVTVELARGQTVQLKGKVTYVGLDQYAGDQYIVMAEVDNRSEQGQWLMKPNDTVNMQIHLGTRVANANLELAPATSEFSQTTNK